MPRPQGIYILDPQAFELIYGPDEQRDIAELVDVAAEAYTPRYVHEHRELLAKVDFIFSGWGGPRLDAEFLDAAPELRVMFYGAGSAGGVLTDETWRRGIQLTTAAAANAIPVAEYTLATILFSLKLGWRFARSTRDQRDFAGSRNVPGCYHTTVGLVSLGIIAQTLRKYLQPFDLHVLAYDPHISPQQARQWNVEMVGLDELFSRADVVSIHTPWLPETEGLIRGSHVARMKPDSTLINTARGAVINEPEMIEVLARRPDVHAILDVTHPEPPAADSPLYTLPNVTLTPHIAGSLANECRRMGRYMVEELRRHLRGEAMQWALTPDATERSIHRPARG
jgi:phosphoglycerate dehydrogenase-like enzyme